MSISYHVKQKKPPKLQSTLSSEIEIHKNDIWSQGKIVKVKKKDVLSSRYDSTSLHYKEGDTITHKPQVHQI